jgi:hypothetical protein
VNHLALDDSNVIAFGELTSSFDFDGQRSPAPDAAEDVFVIKLDSNGNTIFAKHFPGVGQQQTGGVTATSEGDIWIGVAHRQTTDYGGGTVQGFGKDDWVVVKLDATGKHLRSHRFGDPNDQDPRALGADAMGQIYVVGDCAGVMDFGPGLKFGSKGNEDICVARLPP